MRKKSSGKKSSGKKSIQRVSRWIPRFRLSWLFALMTAIAFYVAVSDSHRRAGVKLNEITQLVDASLEEVRTVIYENNVAEFERLNPGDLQPFRNGTPDRPYASLTSFDLGSSRTNVGTGVLSFEPGFERVIRLGAFKPPSLSGDGDVVSSASRRSPRPSSAAFHGACLLAMRSFPSVLMMTLQGTKSLSGDSLANSQSGTCNALLVKRRREINRGERQNFAFPMASDTIGYSEVLRRFACMETRTNRQQ